MIVTIYLKAFAFKGCLRMSFPGATDILPVAMFFFFLCQVWQLEWDMSGMTLASTGSDGVVRLWQSNLNGVWHEQAALESS